MDAIHTIERVLRTSLLLQELTIIPPHGATDAEIHSEENRIGRRLCPDHVALLHRWNGIALEVIRFFGCGDHVGEIGRISQMQSVVLGAAPGAAAIGSDAAGFIYFQSETGEIFSFDTDGGKIKALANGVDDLISRVVFGCDAGMYYGDDWLDELKDAGLVDSQRDFHDGI